jgi:hypothetical protein
LLVSYVASKKETKHTNIDVESFTSTMDLKIKKHDSFLLQMTSPNPLEKLVA